MAAFSAKRIGNWTFSVAGHVFPLEAHLAGRVKQTVPNRADRRRAERRSRVGAPGFEPGTSDPRGLAAAVGATPHGAVSVPLHAHDESYDEQSAESATPATGGDLP